MKIKKKPAAKSGRMIILAPDSFKGSLNALAVAQAMERGIRRVTPQAAPTLCIHGTDDKYVAHEQAVWIVDRLKAAEVEAELLTLPGAGHGFQGKDAEKADQALIAFFDRHLKK